MKYLVLAIFALCGTLTAATKEYKETIMMRAGDYVKLAALPSAFKKVDSTRIFVADFDTEKSLAARYFRSKRAGGPDEGLDSGFTYCRIDTVGKFLCIRELFYRKEKLFSELWTVDVRPAIANPLYDEVYYPGEKGFINFTARFSNDLYSWRIIDKKTGRAIDSARGSVIPMERLTNRPDALAYNEPSHPYVIQGLFDGELFAYKKGMSDTAAASVSEWTVSIQKPKVQTLRTWLKSSEFDGLTEEERPLYALNINSRAPGNLSEFRYAYVSQKQNTRIYTPMKIRSISIESSDPALIFEEARWSADGLFQVVSVGRTENPMGGRSAEIQVTLTIQTQYERLKDTYKAVVNY